MCKVNTLAHWVGGLKSPCQEEDVYKYDISLTYMSGHKKGKTRKITRHCCKKHAKSLRYNLYRKRKSGTVVSIVQTDMNGIIKTL